MKPSLLTLLQTQKSKLAVAESLTGGNLQASITKTSGISAVFEGGITVYSLAQKVKQLGVNRNHAKKVNCVSPRVAAEMAQGVTKLFNTNVGIGTTGYAEPYLDVRTPIAYWAIYLQKTNTTISGCTTGHGLTRTQMQKKVTREVLHALVKLLIPNRGK